MAQKEMQRMMQGAVVLTIASFIAKVLSAFYRVPFQNFVGDEGFYVYQQVYPIYGIAMTLALSGLPQFISKIVAEQPDIRSQKQVLRQLYPYVLWLAIACWAFFFFGSQEIAISMGDAALQPLMEVVSFTFLLVPILSFYRGNFQGHLLMVPSGICRGYSSSCVVLSLLWWLHLPNGDGGYEWCVGWRCLSGTCLMVLQSKNS